MQRERLYLLDIRERIANIQADIAGKVVRRFPRGSYPAFCHLDLIIVGEAAANVPRTLREQYNQVPWGSIVAMRNILVHAYFSVDLPVIWETITRNLQDLEGVVRQMLEREFPENPAS